MMHIKLRMTEMGAMTRAQTSMLTHQRTMSKRISLSHKAPLATG